MVPLALPPGRAGRHGSWKKTLELKAQERAFVFPAEPSRPSWVLKKTLELKAEAGNENAGLGYGVMGLGKDPLD